MSDLKLEFEMCKLVPLPDTASFVKKPGKASESIVVSSWMKNRS